MLVNNNYYIIIENQEQRYLRTKVSQNVLNHLLEDYKNVPNKTETSFGAFLLQNGIECIYDSTFGYINVDEALIINN